MTKVYIEGKEYQSVDFATEGLSVGEYEQCTFRSCNFSKVNCNDMLFVDCELADCDLSMVTLKKSSFRDVKFKNCKILGVRFDECSPLLLSFSFEKCMLNLSTFARLALKGISFNNCVMHEVDFTEADLSHAVFNGCDLQRTIFEQSVLSGADFRSAYGFTIYPERNNLRKAKFSRETVEGLLSHYGILVE